MHVDEPLRPGALVQVVDILRDQQQVARPFGVHTRERPVRRIRLHRRQLRPAIETNGTLYGRQKPKSWETWEKTVPEGFQFAVKGSRYCVSRSKLAESAESITNFFGQGFEVLGPKLGPILWQFAHFRKFHRDDIAAFIDLLPEKPDGLALRHAIEPRHDRLNDG